MNTHNQGYYQGYYRQQTPSGYFGADGGGSSPIGPSSFTPAAPSSSASNLLSNFSMNDIKGFIDRMGGVEGILNTVGKVQKFAQTFSQFAPMVKLLIPKLGASKSDDADDDDYGYRPRRRRRRRRSGGGRRSYGGSQPRRRRPRHAGRRYGAGYGGSYGGNSYSGRGYGKRKRRTSSARRRRSSY